MQNKRFICVLSSTFNPLTCSVCDMCAVSRSILLCKQVNTMMSARGAKYTSIYGFNNCSITLFWFFLLLFLLTKHSHQKRHVSHRYDLLLKQTSPVQFALQVASILLTFLIFLRARQYTLICIHNLQIFICAATFFCFLLTYFCSRPASVM